MSAFVGFFPLFSHRQLPVSGESRIGGWTDRVLVRFDSWSILVGEDVPMLLQVLMIIQEVGIGLLLAMTVGLLLVPAKIAGAYVGQEIGLSLAAISDPGSTDQSTLVTKVFEAISVMLFFGLNLHHFLILILDVSMNQLANRISLLELADRWTGAVGGYAAGVRFADSGAAGNRHVPVDGRAGVSQQSRPDTEFVFRSVCRCAVAWESFACSCSCRSLCRRS